MTTTKMAPMILKMIIFYFACILGGSTVATEEPPSSSIHSQHLNPGMNAIGYEEPSEKRAYTYVSEYKRLPVYNFGLGKRAWVDSGEDKRARPYSFGLGKRTRPFSFGLGKRNDDQEYYPSRVEYLPIESYESYHPREDNLEEVLEDKRGSRLYGFGLGKRGWNIATPDSMDSGKRPSDAISQRYLLGLAKKMIEEEDTSQ